MDGWIVFYVILSLCLWTYFYRHNHKISVKNPDNKKSATKVIHDDLFETLKISLVISLMIIGFVVLVFSSGHNGFSCGTYEDYDSCVENAANNAENN